MPSQSDVGPWSNTIPADYSIFLMSTTANPNTSLIDVQYYTADFPDEVGAPREPEDEGSLSDKNGDSACIKGGRLIVTVDGEALSVEDVRALRDMKKRFEDLFRFV